MIQVLTRHRSSTSASGSVPVVFPGTYPFSLGTNVSARTSLNQQSFTVAQNKPNKFNSGLADTAVTILVLILSSPRKHLVNFLEEFAEIEGTANLSRLLQNFFYVANSVLQNEAFPGNWLNVNVLAHKVVLKMSEPVAFILLQRFIPDPNDGFEDLDSKVWHDCLAMLLRLLASNQLVIEEFSPQVCDFIMFTPFIQLLIRRLETTCCLAFG
jgi:dedicator of cytokinesis protein 3